MVHAVYLLPVLSSGYTCMMRKCEFSLCPDRQLEFAGQWRVTHALTFLECEPVIVLSTFVGSLELNFRQCCIAGQGAQISDLDLAESLMHTCYEMYRQTVTGLAPESGTFHSKGKRFTVGPSEDINKLRPEVVESLFVLHRVTGNMTYVDWGWQIFRAIEMYSRWDTGGYTTLQHVVQGQDPPQRTDLMESFFIAETLKYLLLLFSPPEVRHFLVLALCFNFKGIRLVLQSFILTKQNGVEHES